MKKQLNSCTWITEWKDEPDSNAWRIVVKWGLTNRKINVPQNTIIGDDVKRDPATGCPVLYAWQEDESEPIPRPEHLRPCRCLKSDHPDWSPNSVTFLAFHSAKTQLFQASHETAGTEQDPEPYFDLSLLRTYFIPLIWKNIFPKIYRRGRLQNKSWNMEVQRIWVK